MLKKLTYLLLALFLITFEAIPEGLALAGHKTTGGILEAVYLLCVTGCLFAFITGTVQATFSPYLIRVLIGYVLLRFALFDVLHNVAAGLPWYFIGTTKVYDQLWQWFFAVTKFPDAAFLATVKGILGFMGITFLIQGRTWVAGKYMNR